MRLHFRKGFTLIEIIIYTLIISSILVSMVFITRAMYESRARVRASIILEQNLRFALKRVMTSVRLADDVTLPASGSGTTLTLVMNDPSDDPTTLTEADGVILMSEGGGINIPLTSSEVEVTELTFWRSTSTPPTVRVELTGQLRNASGPYQTELSLTNSAAIRR